MKEEIHLIKNLFTSLSSGVDGLGPTLKQSDSSWVEKFSTGLVVTILSLSSISDELKPSTSLAKFKKDACN
jgi:hypothetical protein